MTGNVKRRIFGWCAGALIIAGLLVAARVGAVPGDGVCTAGSPETASQECAILGPHVLEVVPNNGLFPVTGTCQVSGSPKPCTFWPYRFSGPTGDNQLNILIPATVDIYPNQIYPPTGVSFIGCQQVYAPGVGEPGGFGKGIVTHKVCRVALNIDVGPNTPNLVLATSVTNVAPQAVLSKVGKSVYTDDIDAPFTDTDGVPRLATTLEQITTRSGVVLTVETNQAGDLVSATASSGPVTIYELRSTVFCVPLDPTNVFPNNFPAGYTCGPIVEDDGKNFQVGDNTTCSYRSRTTGKLIYYQC